LLWSKWKWLFMIEQKAFEQFIGAQFGAYRIEQFVEEQHGSPTFLARSGGSPGTYLVRLLTEPASLQDKNRDEYRTSFHRLAGQIAALQHPYLLSIIDYGIQRGIPFLVTPQTTALSLRGYLDKNGPVDVITAGHYLDHICIALEYVYQHGVIHGSLSVDCIHVQVGGQILVEYTGLTSLLTLYRNSALPGLPILADEGSATEQLLGKPTGAFTDVYALGAVLYHILTGEPPFSGRTAQELAHQHLFTPIPSLKQSRSELPPGLYSILARSMAKNPSRRFQQPAALAKAYHRIVDTSGESYTSPAINPSSAASVQLPFVAKMPTPEEQFGRRGQGSAASAISNGNNQQRHQLALLPAVEDAAEDVSNSPTLKRVPAHPGQTTLPLIPEDLSDKTISSKAPALPRHTALSTTLDNLPDTDSEYPSSNRQPALAGQLRFTNIRRHSTAVALLLLLIAGMIDGILLFSRQTASPARLTGQVMSPAHAKILLGLCIILSIAFTVGFNIISRISLSTTKHEYAYTILWQLSCALLVPFFLPFDQFSISISPHVLLLFVLSIALWALVDAFLFSSFKYEEASVLSSIFPLNYVFTFVISTVFFHEAINPTIVLGFLIIMIASLVIGVRYMRLRLSRGIVFALLYSIFQGAALAFNSEVVKSFSIPPYMFAAFLFPAIANLFIFLRPKVSEMRYELRVQWKKILLNAAVMDLSFFFLLKAFELGNVPQVVALSASSTLLTALAGIVILKEDSHVALKILAAALATLGIILVQL